MVPQILKVFRNQECEKILSKSYCIRLRNEFRNRGFVYGLCGGFALFFEVQEGWAGGGDFTDHADFNPPFGWPRTLRLAKPVRRNRRSAFLHLFLFRFFRLFSFPFFLFAFFFWHGISPPYQLSHS